MFFKKPKSLIKHDIQEIAELLDQVADKGWDIGLNRFVWHAQKTPVPGEYKVGFWAEVMFKKKIYRIYQPFSLDGEDIQVQLLSFLRTLDNQWHNQIITGKAKSWMDD